MIATLPNPAELAPSLRRIDPRLLKRDPTGESQNIWFQGGEPYFDVYFRVCEGRVAWFQLTCRGQCATWSADGDRLVTGATNELDPKHGSYPGSKTIAEHEGVDRAVVAFARDVLAARPEEPLFVELARRLGRHLAG